MEVIRVLVVEDSDNKYTDIHSKFTDPKRDLGEYKLHLERAKSYTDALYISDKSYFDVVVLDLMLPLRTGETECKFEYSKSLYEELIGKKGAGPFLIVGLSAYARIDYKNLFFENEIFSIEDYSNEHWFSNVAGRIRFVSKGKAGLRQFLNNNYDIDAILITARKKTEFDPVCAALNWLPNTASSDPRISDFKNMFGIVKLPGGLEATVGVICIGTMGLSTSAGVTARAIQQFRPKFLAMVGMCCGFKSQSETKLGDVVIARQTANWDEGKYKPRKRQPNSEDSYFHNRAIEKSPSQKFVRKVEQELEERQEEIEKNVRSYYGTHDLQKISNSIGMKISGECALHFGLMVSGSSVVDNLSMIEKITSRFPAAVALEMEAHSVYSIAQVMDGAVADILVIKGVADHGDGKKKTEFQPIASVAAAMVALELLETTVLAPQT